MATYSKTRELTVGPAGTALSVYHITSHQNIDSEIQDISTFLGVLGTVTAPTAFTPTWAGTGTAVSLGAGTLSGRYMQVGKIRTDMIQLVLAADSGTGNGQWYFALSGTAATGVVIAGTSHFHKADGTECPGTVMTKDTTHIYAVMTGGTGATTGKAGNGVPVAAFTPLNDYLEIMATYEVA